MCVIKVPRDLPCYSVRRTTAVGHGLTDIRKTLTSRWNILNDPTFETRSFLISSAEVPRSYETAPPLDHHRSLGIVLLKGPTRGGLV